jgi:hypothetical protein
VFLSRLTQRRRRSSTPEVDPQVAVVRYSDVLRGMMRWCGLGVVIGVVAIATDPIPHGGIPVSAIWALVNAGYAFHHTRRDLRRVRSAGEFAPGLSLRVAEPGTPWDIYVVLVALFLGTAYFGSAASAGRYLLAFLAPNLVQAAVTFRAVARRERAGLDLYIHGGEVNAHLRSIPLGAA